MAPSVVALSDDQIERLLCEAEARLASKSSSNALVETQVQATKPSKAARTNGEQQAAETGSGDKTSAKPAAALSVRTPQLRNAKNKDAPRDDAGPGWYNMPRTKLTPELKRDLALLRMRSVINQKQFFRKDTRKDYIPEFSHTGTIVEGPTDFFSGRLTRKERKRTIVEEVLSSGDAMSKFKSRYGEIQQKQTSGKKAFYKKLVAKRRGRG